MKREGIYWMDGSLYGFELLNGKPKNITQDFDHFVKLLQFVEDDNYVYQINMYPKTLIAYQNRIKKLVKKNLIIEIVEFNSSINRKAINSAIKNTNVRISLDDFGSCGSNFDRLYLENLVSVKIDRHLWLDNDYSKLISGLIEMLKDRNILSIAEKVENKIEFEHCKGLGFDLFQGHYFKGK